MRENYRKLKYIQMYVEGEEQRCAGTRTKGAGSGDGHENERGGKEQNKFLQNKIIFMEERRLRGAALCSRSISK